MPKAETYHGLPLPPITLYCDNKSAIKQSSKIYKATGKPSLLRGLVHPLIADFDVLHEIAVVFEAWTTPIGLHHIEAHQDTKKPEQELDVPARLNIRADQLATKAIAIPHDGNASKMLPNAGAVLLSDKGPITRKLLQTIRHDIGETALLA